jgi:hypothetical protein
MGMATNGSAIGREERKEDRVAPGARDIREEKAK